MDKAEEATKSKTRNRQYSADFKQKSVRLAQSVGVKQAAEQLKMPEKTLEKWHYAMPGKKRSTPPTRPQPQTTSSPHKKRDMRTQAVQPPARAPEPKPEVKPEAKPPTMQLPEKTLAVEAPVVQPSESDSDHALRAELKRLRIENAALQQENGRLKQDNDTLEKAAAYFARALQ